MKAPIALAILITTAAAAQPRIDKAELDKLRAELVRIEELTERFKRFIPPAFDLEEETRRISAAAAKAGLGNVDVRVVATEQKTPLEIHEIEVAGKGSYAGANFFVYMLRLTRPLDAVSFEAREGGDVAFLARFSQPVWKGQDPPPPAGNPVLDLRAALDRRSAALDVINAAVDRAMVHQSVDALAALSSEVEEERVALTKATAGKVLTIEGFAVGSAARAAVESALVKTKLQPARIRWSEKGRCRAFAIETAAPPPSEPQADEPYVDGREIFDGASAKFCGVPASQPRKVVAKRRGSGESTLFLKMRGVDAGRTFFVLNDLFNEHFVVDPDVRGRIDLDAYAGATLDDLYAALNDAGIHIGPGPLRRVATANVPRIAAKGDGEPITVSFQEANLSDVLCLMKNVAGRKITMTAAQQRSVHVFAYELPAGLLADALTPPAAPGALDPCSVATAPRSRLARTTQKGIAEWPIDDLRLVGVATLGSGARAYVEVPTGMNFVIESGAEVRDGQVKKITMDGVTFDRGGHEVVVGMK